MMWLSLLLFLLRWKLSVDCGCHSRVQWFCDIFRLCRQSTVLFQSLIRSWLFFVMNFYFIEYQSQSHQFLIYCYDWNILPFCPFHLTLKLININKTISRQKECVHSSDIKQRIGLLNKQKHTWQGDDSTIFCLSHLNKFIIYINNVHKQNVPPHNLFKKLAKMFKMLNRKIYICIIIYTRNPKL